MKLRIMSPESDKTYDIAWVELNTKVGNFIILPEHAPMTVTLKSHENLTFCLANGKQETIKPTGGTAEVKRKEINLLLFSVP